MFSLLSAFSFGLMGCASQHYVVRKATSTNFPLEFKVQALDGRVTGYSLYLNNNVNKTIEVDWENTHMRQDNGFEIPLSVTPSSKLSKIMAGGSVEYHLQPKHYYQTPDRRGKSQRQIFWQDINEKWPDEQVQLLLSYRFVENGKCSDCSWNIAKIDVDIAASTGNKTQEKERWVDDRIYTPPIKKKKWIARTGLGVGTIGTYYPSSGTSFLLEGDYILNPSLSVGAALNLASIGSELVSDQELEQGSQTILARGSWNLAFGRFLQLTPHLQFGLLNNNYTYDSLSWQEGNLLVGGGSRLSVLFQKVDVFLGYEYNVGLVNIGTEAPSQFIGKLTSATMNQFQLGVGYSF